SIEEFSTIPLQLYSGTTKIYDSVNSLSALSLSSGELTPAFHPDTLTYTVDLPHSVSGVTVTASVHDDSTAGVMVNGNAVTSGQASGEVAMNVGENIITIDVTTPYTSTKTYTITVVRAAESSSYYPPYTWYYSPPAPSKVV